MSEIKSVRIKKDNFFIYFETKAKALPYSWIKKMVPGLLVEKPETKWKPPPTLLGGIFRTLYAPHFYAFHVLIFIRHRHHHATTYYASPLSSRSTNHLIILAMSLRPRCCQFRLLRPFTSIVSSDKELRMNWSCKTFASCKKGGISHANMRCTLWDSWHCSWGEKVQPRILHSLLKENFSK